MLLIGKPSINGPFSMAMLNNQMVIGYKPAYDWGPSCKLELGIKHHHNWGMDPANIGFVVAM
jgi:hypothetical protein